MTMAHFHIEHRGHTLPFRGTPSNHEDHRFDHDRVHYRLPPPHSSIPLGLKTDNRYLPHRAKLPSVHQLLCSEDPSPYAATPYHGRSPRNSPPSSQHSRDSPLYLHNGFREAGDAAFRPTISPNDEAYHTSHSQSTRLPSLSQVGIEPPRSHAVPPDQDFQRGHHHHHHHKQREFTTSPEGSSQGSPEMQHRPSVRQQQRGRGAQGPTLPAQVVEERFVAGKGLCYIFADQSHCPKSIDGELVNPNWGLTKAGKARKRLAQACIPCREKKIKCQPSLPRCDQCQKSGRDCRFESAPRGNRARSSSYDSHSTRPGSRQMMRSTPGSPREVDMAVHSLPPSNSGSPSFFAAPTSHPFVHETHALSQQPKTRADGIPHAHKRRRRGEAFVDDDDDDDGIQDILAPF